MLEMSLRNTKKELLYPIEKSAKRLRVWGQISINMTNGSKKEVVSLYGAFLMLPGIAFDNLPCTVALLEKFNGYFFVNYFWPTNSEIWRKKFGIFVEISVATMWALYPFTKIGLAVSYAPRWPSNSRIVDGCCWLFSLRICFLYRSINFFLRLFPFCRCLKSKPICI